MVEFGEIVFNLRYQPAGGRIVQNRDGVLWGQIKSFGG